MNVHNSFYRKLKKEVKKVMSMPKFMQSLSKETYDKLLEIARKKGIKIQELIRVIVIPEWFEQKEKKE